MIDGKKVLAIIPARAGSKGVPGKNIKPLGGKPLIAHSISAAFECGIVDKVCVSTDGEEIAKVARAFGADIVPRPPEMARDSSKVEDAVVHLVKTLEAKGERFDLLVLLQPTSPLRNAGHLRAAIELFIKEAKGCLISLTPTEHPPYKCYVEDAGGGSLKPLFGTEMLFGPRQSLPKTYRDAGAIYIMPVKDFLERPLFYRDPFTPFILDGKASIDIDTDLDFIMAEAAMLQT